MAAVFVDFPTNKCNFRYRTAGPIPHRAAAPYEEEFFSWGSRHQCLMEVGACGLLYIVFRLFLRSLVDERSCSILSGLRRTFDDESCRRDDGRDAVGRYAFVQTGVDALEPRQRQVATFLQRPSDGRKRAVALHRARRSKKTNQFSFVCISFNAVTFRSIPTITSSTVASRDFFLML